MNMKKWAIAGCVLFLSIGLIDMDRATADVRAGSDHAPTQARPDQPKSPEIGPEIGWITADELKAILTKNEPVTIIDLRSSATYYDDPSKIKGALHVKERRLRYRLSFSPFKELPRDGLIVTYCACPSDDISIRGAQILLDAGFKGARVLKGGWQAWLKAGGQLEAKPKL